MIGPESNSIEELFSVSWDHANHVVSFFESCYLPSLAKSCHVKRVTLSHIEAMGCGGSKEVVNDEERLSFLSKVLHLSNSHVEI